MIWTGVTALGVFPVFSQFLAAILDFGRVSHTKVTQKHIFLFHFLDVFHHVENQKCASIF